MVEAGVAAAKRRDCNAGMRGSLLHARLAGLIGGASQGSFLSPERICAYASIAVGIYACVLVYMIWVGLHIVRDKQPPIAGDFGQVWAAGHAVLQGHPLAPYDLNAHIANLKIVFGTKAPNYVFVYPPFCLAVAGALALMPYLVAFVLEQALMLALYLRSISLILPQRLALLAALALPSLMINIGYGQIGTLTAGLAGTAAAILDRRPALAGVLFACMAYKPQLGVAIPVALIAGRRWTTVAAAGATLALLFAASTAAYGWPSWGAFLGSMHTAGSFVFSRGAVDWFKLQSVFAAARLWGASALLAWIVQGAAALAALAAVAWAWHREGDTRLKAALLLAAGLLCTPYCFEYDMVVFGPAIALIVSYSLEHGFRRWEKTLLASFGFIPLVAGLVAHHAHIPLGLVGTIGMPVMIVRKIQAASAA
jgi:hypothetical protein